MDAGLPERSKQRHKLRNREDVSKWRGRFNHGEHREARRGKGNRISAIDESHFGLSVSSSFISRLFIFCDLVENQICLLLIITNGFVILYKTTVMTRQVLIDKVLKKIKLLPDSKLEEINDFADFLLNRLDDRILTEGIRNMAADSKAFEFLNEEEDLYSVNDLKERYK